jgi:beta-lactamase class A
MKNNANAFMILLAVLLIGAAGGWIVKSYSNGGSSNDPQALGQVRANLPQYKFINPLLFSDTVKSGSPKFQKLAASLDSYIRASEQSKSVDSASVYFRDLNTGRWTGANEDSLYTPSSMLKVVAMMAALKMAEADPTILSKKMHYIRPHTDSPYDFKAPNTVTEGYYPLQDLIGFMIKDSDNGAFDAIVSDPAINNKFAQTYSLFRLPPQALAGSTTDFMSPKSFSAVFRVLYNSSFFEWNLSEQVLSLLSQTTFTKGLVSGVPAGTLVAHKFGENTDELHDCGIVYHPERPYLICVMTRGTDENSMESAIQHISSMVWDAVDKGDL